MNELKHYGVLGMKWGVRKQPEHSNILRRNQKEEPPKQRGLTDKQKKILKIGAISAETALAAYGGYKLAQSGKLKGLDNSIEAGKMKVRNLFKKKAGSADGVFGSQKVSDLKGGKPYEIVNGIKKMSVKESLGDTLRKTNPKYGDESYQNNCTLCSITAFLRQQGYDVSAGSTGGKRQNLAGMVDECFKGAKVFDGSAIKFGRSKKDAAEMLVKRFGDNADGVVGIQWRQGGGHAFNWSIKNGDVTFFDGQWGRDDAIVSKYWSSINQKDSLILARLDNAVINFDGIKKYLETD